MTITAVAQTAGDALPFATTRASALRLGEPVMLVRVGIDVNPEILGPVLVMR